MSHNPYGVVVHIDKMSFLFTTSQDADETVRRMEVVRQQHLRRLQKHERVIEALRRGADEIRAREAAGKARRPARKREA